jgi:hypothetical protein
MKKDAYLTSSKQHAEGPRPVIHMQEMGDRGVSLTLGRKKL